MEGIYVHFNPALSPLNICKMIQCLPGIRAPRMSDMLDDVRDGLRDLITRKLGCGCLDCDCFVLRLGN